MRKKSSVVNELIPADELYWDDDEKKHIAVSRDEEHSLIRACLRCGLSEDQTLKIVQGYSLSKTSSMLFKHFIDGNIDVYSFSERGEPIFSKPKKEGFQHLDLLLINNHEDLPENRFDELLLNSVEFRDGLLCCSYSLEDIPFDKIFDTVLNWCSNNGFDILQGENPDDDSTWINKDPLENFTNSPRTWKINNLELEKETYLHLTLEVGRWFEFEEKKDEV